MIRQPVFAVLEKCREGRIPIIISVEGDRHCIWRREHMTVDEILTKVREMAGQDEELLHRILQTASGEHPVDSFCSLCRDLGFTLYAMDLVDAGEEAYAAIRRSTNGGGENSPMLAGSDDYYEMFLAELKKRYL